MSDRRWFDSPSNESLRWDWPHRLWHWLFAGTLSVSLGTGLAGDVALMDVHLTSGGCALVLLLFRLGWAVWGGAYARLQHYRTSPRAIWQHFTRQPVLEVAHTAPGAALALTMWCVTAIQAGTGLFSSDDIFTDGPFVRYASDAAVDLATAVHTRLFWLLLALIATHLVALAWYAAQRDPLVLSMFNGRRAGPMAPVVHHHLLRGLLTLMGAAALIWAGSRWL